MDPFVVLGIARNSSPQDIRNAWRNLAKKSHPDVGGEAQQMVRLNLALSLALEMVQHRGPSIIQNEVKDDITTTGRSRGVGLSAREKNYRVRQDVSSFTFSVLPVESFELLEIVANSSGSIIESDCPYLVEFSLENFGESFSSSDWCRCELVPEAGGTMVHLTIGGDGSNQLHDVEIVRDELIRCINEIDDVSPAQ